MLLKTKRRFVHFHSDVHLSLRVRTSVPFSSLSPKTVAGFEDWKPTARFHTRSNTCTPALQTFIPNVHDNFHFSLYLPATAMDEYIRSKCMPGSEIERFNADARQKKNMDITIGNSIPVCVQILTTELLSVCKKNWNRLSSWDWLSRLFEKNDNRFGNKTWLLWHFLWHTLRVIDSDIEVIVIIVNVSSICYIQLVCLQLCFHIWNGRQMKMHGCTDVIRFQVHGRYAFNRWTVGDIRQSGQSYRDEVRMYYLTSDSGGAP